MPKTGVKGGKKLAKFLHDARRGKRVSRIEVGFDQGDKYPDGTPVTNVAAWQEFGTEDSDGNVHIPERPFFRQAVMRWPEALNPILRKNLNPRTMVVDQQLADLLGLEAQFQVVDSIDRLDEPALAPSTIARKRRLGYKEPTNPLVASGFMRSHVEYRVEQ